MIKKISVLMGERFKVEEEDGIKKNIASIAER